MVKGVLKVVQVAKSSAIDILVLFKVVQDAPLGQMWTVGGFCRRWLAGPPHELLHNRKILTLHGTTYNISSGASGGTTRARQQESVARTHSRHRN